MMLTRLALTLLLAGGVVLLPSAFEPTAAEAATTKKKSTKRSDFTPEQRERMMAQGRQICRKKFGTASKLFRIDYTTMRVWCRTG